MERKGHLEGTSWRLVGHRILLAIRCNQLDGIFESAKCSFSSLICPTSMAVDLSRATGQTVR